MNIVPLYEACTVSQKRRAGIELGLRLLIADSNPNSPKEASGARSSFMPRASKFWLDWHWPCFILLSS
jgi:hypothetical protein